MKNTTKLMMVVLSIGFLGAGLLLGSSLVFNQAVAPLQPTIKPDSMDMISFGDQENNCNVSLNSDTTTNVNTFEIDIPGEGDIKTQLSSDEYINLSNVMNRMFPYKPLLVK